MVSLQPCHTTQQKAFIPLNAAQVATVIKNYGIT
jgi:hypothetical protein